MSCRVDFSSQSLNVSLHPAVRFMASQLSPNENLKLTFRVDDSATKRSGARYAWFIWCLIGVAMGISSWVLGRHLLTEHLGTSISEAEDRDEAMLALAGLSILGDDAIEPVTRALTHQDAQVARAAYRLLDQRVSQWQANPEEAADKFKTLSTLLNSIPADVLPDRLTLASNLATRMHIFCETSENNELAAATKLCQQVIDRALQAQYTPLAVLTPPSDSGSSLSTNSSQQPVSTSGLALPSNDGRSLASSITSPASNSISDDQYTDPGGVSISMNDNSPAYAALRDTEPPSMPLAIPQPLRSVDDALHSSTGSPMATVQLVPRSSMNPNAHSDDAAEPRVATETSASYSLGSQPSTSWSTPVAVRLQDNPIQRIVSIQNVSLDEIPDLPVDRLVRLLGSTAPQVAQTAALTLRSKNMSEESLALASELATCASDRKLELMEQISRREEPRPWLLWLAEDPDPIVRRQAVSLLSAMVDRPTSQQLYSLLNVESDPDVALTIRRVLAQVPGQSIR